jgi:hypothetical protein
VVDTLRFRNFDGGILTVSDKGVVSNDASPEFQNLTVTGQTILANTLCESLTVNSVNALASVRTPSAAIGQLDASSAVIQSLNSSRATVTQLNASTASITLLDVSSAIIGYLPQFDPSGNFFSILPSSATLPQLIAGYNQLISLFANRTIFLSVSPLLIFQTPCEIHIAEYLTTSPNIRIDFMYSQLESEGIAAGAIVNTLNQSAIAAGAKLRFSFNSATSKVSYQEASGYSWVFTDPNFYGSANRLFNHLGITGLIASENGEFSEYGSGIGAVVANPTGDSPPTPAAPAAPTQFGPSTAHGFIIVIPAPIEPNDVKKIGIFLDHGSGTIHSWDLIDYPALNNQYTFKDLAPSTLYTVHLSFLSTYDESDLSSGLEVETEPSTFTEFNVLESDATTLTPPPFNEVYNNEFYVVAKTTAAVWDSISNLYQVNQIVAIELEYYSGFNEAPTNYDGSPNIQDARFSFYSNPSSPNDPPVSDDGGVLLYYAYNRRVAVTGPGNELYAIGSSRPITSILPSPPSSSTFISDQNTLRNIFGNGTNYINKNKGFQFAWFCGYGGSLIQNMNISKFIIYYIEDINYDS